MKSFCRHIPHNEIMHIKAPRWSTDDVLIDTSLVTSDNLILRFTDESPKNKYGLFWLPGDKVKKCKTQTNGRIQIYVVPLKWRDEFVPKIKCEHTN